MRGQVETAPRKVLGRMPDKFLWAPSRPLPWWFGNWRPDGRMTREQVEGLMKLGRDPVTAETMPVRREASLEEVWVPGDSYRPVYEFPCPIVGKGKGDTIRVLAPNGSEKDVRADGWSHKPSPPRPSGWMGF